MLWFERRQSNELWLCGLIGRCSRLYGSIADMASLMIELGSFKIWNSVMYIVKRGILVRFHSSACITGCVRQKLLTDNSIPFISSIGTVICSYPFSSHPLVYWKLVQNQQSISLVHLCQLAIGTKTSIQMRSTLHLFPSETDLPIVLNSAPESTYLHTGKRGCCQWYPVSSASY